MLSLDIISTRLPFVWTAAAYRQAVESIDIVKQAIEACGEPGVAWDTSAPITIVGLGKNGLGGLESATLQVVPPNLALTFMQTLEQYWGCALATWATFNTVFC